MDLNNKIIVITGASRGIGKCMAYYFAGLGSNLIITYNTKQNMANIVKYEIESRFHINIDCVKCDLKNENDIIELYNFIKSKYNRIDILINNAAISLDSPFDLKSKEEFMDILEVNVVGTFLMIKYMSSLMNINGYIFNISSTDGINTGSSLNIDYSASKAAINNMTGTLSLVLKSRIISICPNWVNTESIQEMNQDYLLEEMKRVNQHKLIEPIEIAKTIEKCIDDNIPSGSIMRIDGE